MSLVVYLKNKEKRRILRFFVSHNEKKLLKKYLDIDMSMWVCGDGYELR